MGESIVRLDHWDALVRDYERKFQASDISDAGKQAAMGAIAPTVIYDHRIAGHPELNSYLLVRQVLDDIVRDKRNQKGLFKPKGNSGPTPMDIEGLQAVDPPEPLQGG